MKRPEARLNIAAVIPKGSLVASRDEILGLLLTPLHEPLSGLKCHIHPRSGRVSGRAPFNEISSESSTVAFSHEAMVQMVQLIEPCCESVSGVDGPQKPAHLSLKATSSIELEKENQDLSCDHLRKAAILQSKDATFASTADAAEAKVTASNERKEAHSLIVVDNGCASALSKTETVPPPASNQELNNEECSSVCESSSPVHPTSALRTSISRRSRDTNSYSFQEGVPNKSDDTGVAGTSNNSPTPQKQARDVCADVSGVSLQTSASHKWMTMERGLLDVGSVIPHPIINPLLFWFKVRSSVCNYVVLQRSVRSTSFRASDYDFRFCVLLFAISQKHGASFCWYYGYPKIFIESLKNTGNAVYMIWPWCMPRFRSRICR